MHFHYYYFILTELGFPDKQEKVTTFSIDKHPVEKNEEKTKSEQSMTHFWKKQY